MNPFKWNDVQFEGSHFVGMLSSPWTFTETIARLITLTEQDPRERTDQDKVTVEFSGYYKGKYFTLYDYKEDDQVHIGGNGDVDIKALELDLIEELRCVPPMPYRARYYYEGGRRYHEWKGDPLAIALKRRFKKGDSDGKTLRRMRRTRAGISRGSQVRHPEG